MDKISSAVFAARVLDRQEFRRGLEYLTIRRPFEYRCQASGLEAREILAYDKEHGWYEDKKAIDLFGVRNQFVGPREDPINTEVTSSAYPDIGTHLMQCRKCERFIELNHGYRLFFKQRQESIEAQLEELLASPPPGSTESLRLIRDAIQRVKLYETFDEYWERTMSSPTAKTLLFPPSR